MNLFVPTVPGDPDAVAAYAGTLRPDALRLGVALGEPRWDDDDFDAKVGVVEEAGSTPSASPSAARTRPWSTACTGPAARWP